MQNFSKLNQSKIKGGKGANSTGHEIGAQNFLHWFLRLQVIRCQQVHPNFHARYNATQREYLYRICYGTGRNRELPLFMAGTTWCCDDVLDVNAMRVS